MGRTGTVSVESFQQRLRLRWRVGGKQYCLSVGLPDTPESRVTAEIKARQIWLDIISNNFDSSLKKYGGKGNNTSGMGGNNSAKSSVSVSVRQAFNLFIEERHLGTRSVEKYRTLMNHLAALGLDGCPIDSLDIQPIYRHFNTANSPRTAKDYLIALNAVLQHSGIKNNRLGDAINAIKLCPKQPPKPFTQDEVQAILGAFSRLFPHYYNYVLFRFSTGMRTAEINGLQWQHVADDCSQIWVGTSLRRNIRKATKTNKARIIPCNQTLQTLLLEIKPSDWAPLDLVFVTSRGHAIHDNAFATQHWQPSLLLAGVDYRKPYLTRHTFITRCLESGMPPTVLASIVGHDIQTMFQHYVGHTITAKIPELF